MVRSTVDQLKADAFKLAKILATFKVKLSSQQCLDVLSRLRWNQPYEAIRVLPSVPIDSDSQVALPASQPLKEWLACGQEFCDLVKTLDRNGVMEAAWPSQNMPNGVHWDGVTYLRAAGVTAERFSRIAETYALSCESQLMRSLKFRVEAGEPVVRSEIATLRIQLREDAGQRKQPKTIFVPVSLRQRRCEPLLFGSEARVTLTTNHEYDKTIPYQMEPAIRLTYEVAGQSALRVFAQILKEHLVQPLWQAAGGFDVETSILLTKNNVQESIEEEWKTADDPDGQRLRKFCLKASRLSPDVTSDWPPYLRLTRLMGTSDTEEDFDRYFAAVSAHTLCIEGGSGGWHEVLEET